jgi:hypothetical protein
MHVGMTPLEYFVSCHGARHGLVDKGLMTAIAGDLMNVILQSVQDLFITEEDCKTKAGIEIESLSVDDEILIPLYERIVNRYLATDLKLNDGEIIPAGSLITKERAEKIRKDGINKVYIRSPITCESKTGVCKLCYGIDLSTDGNPPIGYPVGVIAAQSIGERGTQFTLRTFHTGGASSGVAAGIDRAKALFNANETVKSYFKNNGNIKTGLFLLNELQQIYCSYGIIADHHFETIIRRMVNNAENKLQGILHIGKHTEGFLARTGFRSVERNLVEAAISKAEDDLIGFKAKVIAGSILGHLGV